MTQSWTLAVARTELARTTLVEHPAPDPKPGEAVLRVDRLGMSANNVTYAVLGESFRYWEFFPPRDRGLGPEWGLMPCWGFADVVASTVAGMSEGDRYFGYLPPSGHLTVLAGRVSAYGFRDTSDHRAKLPSAYNSYALTSTDAAYDRDREDLMALFRPLFFTSFMLADQLEDQQHYGAQALLFSSASSKTAYGTAFELRGKGPRLIGLTSPGNVEHTRQLDLYDDVLSYDELSTLSLEPRYVYLDFAGSPTIRTTLREHCGDRLIRDITVGITTMVGQIDQGDRFFFAPNQMRKRAKEWGRAGLDERLAQAWHRFIAAAEPWVDITVSHGPEGLRSAWLDTLAGRTPPRVGQVIHFS